MENSINQTRAQFIRAKEQLAYALATTPDEWLNWSPAPTARTPIEQVAHGAMAVGGILAILEGKPSPFASSAALDTALRSAEKEYTTREQALHLLETNSAAFLSWLDTLTPDTLETMVYPPFGPPSPMTVGITFPAYHLGAHTAQLDYIQTIYGDRNWHQANQ